jgi:hypothetical protein
MIRYSLFVLTVIATAATAIASIAPTADKVDMTGPNVTVIEKNQAFPVYGPITVEECATEDCAGMRT